jgi:hypothetical protein
VLGASFLKVSLCEGRVMAQEAKSPPAGTATAGAGDNPFDIKGTSAGDIGDDASYPPSGAEGQKKLSLAERLRAEQQRKTSEPKMEEPKSSDLGDAGTSHAAWEVCGVARGLIILQPFQRCFEYDDKFRA